jgi:4-amino-4-deoxy-L-arabinose transferase-like glycosyltransferase
MLFSFGVLQKAFMLKKYLISLEKEDASQYFIAFLCLLVYAGSLFFPLMDKDAAHHANIALYMYEHNDWVSLVDRGRDYLDKPHFLFWTSLVSFKIFGVNTFAHRFPAILFSLLSIYSTYKLTRHLSDKTTAKIAAAILATAQAFVLSITDARMETPLTAGIVLGLWQMIIYIDKQKFSNILFAALGAAIAFSTKGWLGPVIIFVSSFFYIALNKRWRILFSYKTWLFLPLFFVFISPVLYAYYLEYDLHPEKVVRGRDHISGVKFILWDQLFERYKGFDVGGRNSGYFFLYHTFLWAFFPWSIIAAAAVFFWLKRMFYKRKWDHALNFAALSFAFILFAISFSKFKMPHYIVMLLPLAAMFTAPYLRFILSYKKPVRFYLGMQVVFGCLVFIAIIILNYYFFHPVNWFIVITGPLMLATLGFIIVRRFGNKAMKVFYVSAFLSLVFNFFLNYNFFPNLLKYQGGNELVKLIKEKNISIPDDEIVVVESGAHSFEFYRKHTYRIAETHIFLEEYPGMKNKYFLITNEIKDYLAARGYNVKPVISHLDYNVTTVQLKFLDPATRIKNCDTLMLAKIDKP